jgi:stromal interaction molecule 1
MLKLELQRAEGELEDRCWSPPAGLQHWLQLTHEIENKAYTNKKIAAEKQLQQAREAVRESISSDANAFNASSRFTIASLSR